MTCFWSNPGKHLWQLCDTKTTTTENSMLFQDMKHNTIKLHEVNKTVTEPNNSLHLLFSHTHLLLTKKRKLKLLQKFLPECNQHGKYQPELLHLCQTLRKYSKWSLQYFNTGSSQVLSASVLWQV